MEWVNSAGGPIVCGEECVCNSWLGIHGLSAAGSKTAANDYQRACECRNYVDILPCASGQILVLGDEPLQSSFFIASDGVLSIARWVYSKNRDVEELLISSKLEFLEKNTPLSLPTGGRLGLFDSANVGATSGYAKSRVSLSAGEYTVTTERIKKEREHNFLIHRFLRAS